MKNKLVILLSFTMILVTFWGCATSSAPANRSGSTEQTRSAMPSWVINPEISETHFLGIGMAKKQNPSLAQKTAKARARDEIAAQISVQVENLMKDFMQESGIGETAQSLEFTSSVSKQVVSKTLEGSVPDKQFAAADGTWYVRVKYSRSDAKKAMLDAASREEALFNEFKADQGFDDLEKAIGNLKK